MTPRVYLIRHGQTEWSLSGRHTGRTDLPLTAQGEEDARALRPRLSRMEFSQVFTSPRQRARRTCALTGWETVAALEPDLAEWDYGDYEGQLSTEIHRTRPGWNIFSDGCPGGESPAGVSARADRLITRLQQFEGNVALFSHGHFSRVLGVRWIGLPIIQARHLLLDTASLSILGFEHNQMAEPAIVLWNAVGREEIAR